MKKFLLSLLFLMPLSGFAQKGMQGVGVNLGWGFDIWRFDYAYSYGFSYQKSVTDRFRLASSLEVLDDEVNATTSYLLIVEGNYFLNDVRRLRPYVIGGVALGRFESEAETWIGELGGGFAEFAFGGKFGVGLNYRLGYHLTGQLEIPCYLISSTSCVVPSLGLVYTF